MDNGKLASPLYSINDAINLTCVQPSSRPAPKLSWLLNDAPLALGSSQTSETSGEQTVRSQLAFSVQPEHLLSSLVDSPRTRLRFTCLARLELDYSAEAQVSLAAGRAIGLRRSAPASASAELPAALPLLDAPSEPTAQLVNLTDPLIYRWPPSALRLRDNRGHSARVEPSTEKRLDPELASRRPPSPASAGRIQPRQMDLRAQSDHIEHILRSTQPNQLDSPVIEARSVWRRPALWTSASPSPDDKAAEGAEFEPDELVEFTCKPRIDAQTLARLPSSRIRWFLNRQELAATNGSLKVSLFDGHKFRLTSALDPEQPQAVQESELAKDTQLGRSRLLVQFTSSLLQLKELNLKCQTQLEQTLIEYASEPFLAQVHGGGGAGAGEPTEYIQVMDKPASNRTRARHYFSTNRRHNSAPARARQASSSAASSELGVSLLLLLLVLGRLLAARY